MCSGGSDVGKGLAWATRERGEAHDLKWRTMGMAGSHWPKGVMFLKGEIKHGARGGMPQSA